MTQKGSTIESIHANKNIGTKQGDAAIGMPFAEIVVWKWNQNAQQVIIAVCARNNIRELITQPGIKLEI